LYVCHDLTDRLAPLALFTQLRVMDYDQLYFEFNVGTARQAYLGAEVIMRAVHTLEKKGELEDKCAEQTVLLSKRDAKIAHLKSLLYLKETEAVEAIRLRGQLTTVEVADAAKDSELKDLKEKNFMLEGERDVMSEKIATLESANVAKEAELASLSSQVAKLTSDISDLQLSRDELNSQRSSLEFAFELFSARMKATQDEHAKSPEYCHALGMAIGCAINKEAKYIEAVNALGAVDFSLLYELKSKKDASIVDLMDSLRLEGPLAEIPEAEDLQPSPAQLRLPIHWLEDNVFLSETSISFSPQVVHS
nr:hypothetical protein [Tanacetum cinerariifolium]